MSPPAPAGAAVRARASPFPMGRRVPAGLCAPPGTYSTLPAWSSRERWLTHVVCAVAAGRDICRQEHVDPDTLVRVARAHARYADHRTGRECRPTNDQLAADLQMSVRQIQRGRRVLKRLLLLAETQRGRSILSRAERLAAWRRGSSARHLAATFALTGLRAHPRPCRCPVDDVTPPGYAVGVSGRSPTRGVLRGHRPKRQDERRSAPALQRARARPPRGLAEAKAQRLIAGVQERVGWLRSTSPRRLTPLRRLARQGWTPRDVHRALDDVLRARNWRVPERVEHPAAYLAALLRDVDPADRPGALDEAMLADERARRAWLWQTSTGPACEHGAAGGDIPHPSTGHVACQLCRARSRQEVVP